MNSYTRTAISLPRDTDFLTTLKHHTIAIIRRHRETAPVARKASIDVTSHTDSTLTSRMQGIGQKMRVIIQRVAQID